MLNRNKDTITNFLNETPNLIAHLLSITFVNHVPRNRFSVCLHIMERIAHAKYTYLCIYIQKGTEIWDYYFVHDSIISIQLQLAHPHY